MSTSISASSDESEQVLGPQLLSNCWFFTLALVYAGTFLRQEEDVSDDEASDEEGTQRLRDVLLRELGAHP